MLTPKSHGGMEIDFPTSMEIIEAIGEADGATGWTVMIGSETPQLFALLPRNRFDQIYAAGPDVIAAEVSPRAEPRSCVVMSTSSTGDGLSRADANIAIGSSATAL